MYEFDCAKCGLHVIEVVGEPHPENVYCLECRWIESLEGEDRAAAEEFFAKIHAPRE